MLNEALPPLRFFVPSEVEPSKNRTCPVAPAGDTVASGPLDVLHSRIGARRNRRDCRRLYDLLGRRRRRGALVSRIPAVAN